MSKPESYFSRGEPKIKSHGEMMQKLKERSTAHASLIWLPPVKATQRTDNGRYEIRATRQKGEPWYTAWSLCSGPIPKLLGYSGDPVIARNFCETHAIEEKKRAQPVSV